MQVERHAMLDMLVRVLTGIQPEAEKPPWSAVQVEGDVEGSGATTKSRNGG